MADAREMTSPRLRHELDLDAPCLVAGRRGLAGSAIWRALERAGHRALVGPPSEELDLTERSAVLDFVAECRPATVVLAAARVGGIGANLAEPHRFLSENLRIQVNVMDAAARLGVRRLLFLSSSCVYPVTAPRPIPEDALLTGPLEPTSAAYATAKIAGMAQVRAVRQQHGLPWIVAVPSNLYGPGDNFSPTGSHVVAGLVRRYEEARTAGLDEVVNWGTGSPRRELLHVDDMAEACVHLLRHHDDAGPVNVGTGRDATVAGIAALVAEAVGFRGRTRWDPAKPDGVPQKLLDVSTLRDAGWTARIGLREGLASTVSWYREHVSDLREVG